MTTNETLVKKYKAEKHHLSRIPLRYLEIFEYRTGITDGALHTQKETGERFGISTTRAGQLEARVKYELDQIP